MQHFQRRTTISHNHEILIALVNSATGQDAEFNSWYTDVHLPEVVALPGFIQAQRYEAPEELAGSLAHRYATVYEIEGSAAEAMKLLFTAGLGSSDTIDLSTMVFGAYKPRGEAITPT